MSGMDQVEFFKRVLTGMNGGGNVTIHRFLEVDASCTCGWTYDDAPELDEDASMLDYFQIHVSGTEGL